MKRCYKCKELKSFDHFSKDSGRKDGYSGMCKTCWKLHYKLRGDVHKGQVAAWYVRNREAYKFRRKVWSGVWAKRNPDKVRERNRKWREANLELNRQCHSNSNHKRRTEMKEGDRIHLSVLYERDEGICQICKKPCTKEEASIDYIKPVSKGGKHIWGNVQLAHLLCNIRKGTKFEEAA